MNSLFSVFFLVSLFFEPQIVRDEFHQLQTQKQENVFILKYQNDPSPSIQAYVCAVEMKQAEYAFNPIKKLKVFVKTKKKLELLIEKNPSNIDLRYIRLLLQERTPSILGYKDRIQEDKQILSTKLSLKEISKELEVYIYNNTSL